MLKLAGGHTHLQSRAGVGKAPKLYSDSAPSTHLAAQSSQNLTILTCSTLSPHAATMTPTPFNKVIIKDATQDTPQWIGNTAIGNHEQHHHDCNEQSPKCWSDAPMAQADNRLANLVSCTHIPTHFTNWIDAEFLSHHSSPTVDDWVQAEDEQGVSQEDMTLQATTVASTCF